MPSSFEFRWLNPRLENLPAAIMRGLEGGGIAFNSEEKRYPPQRSKYPYKRTGTLGNTAHYQVGGGAGHYTMDVGGVYYMPYVLFGTCKWVGWPGKLAKAKSELVRGFVVVFKKAIGK